MASVVRPTLAWMGKFGNCVKCWVLVVLCFISYHMGYDTALVDSDNATYIKQFIQARQTVSQTVSDEIKKVKNAKKQIGLTTN